MLRRFFCLVVVLVASGGQAAAATGGPTPAASSGPAASQPAPVPDRGALLYATHCVACHTEQVHWRDRKAAGGWQRLKAEVRRWQAAARLGWSEADIVAVARYLNETIYRLPQTDDGVARLPPGEWVADVARAPR